MRICVQEIRCCSGWGALRSDVKQMLVKFFRDIEEGALKFVCKMMATSPREHPLAS